MSGRKACQEEQKKQTWDIYLQTCHATSRKSTGSGNWGDDCALGEVNEVGKAQYAGIRGESVL